jgi:hypothetical protein
MVALPGEQQSMKLNPHLIQVGKLKKKNSRQNLLSPEKEGKN